MEERFPLLAAVVEEGHVEALVAVRPHVGQLVEDRASFLRTGAVHKHRVQDLGAAVEAVEQGLVALRV